MRRFHPLVWLLFALAAMTMPIASKAQIISITIAPPELPVYEQPAIPDSGYMWSPGYWAWGPYGYFWVPGTWVLPPAVGVLWTPGYWGWRDGIYAWNAGYWGPHIGFYGGVNYGFGYGGIGYEGGYWNNGVFAYNRSVNNFGGVAITNVYNKTVVVNPNVTRASFNGGTGGTTAQPTPQEQAAAHEQHIAATLAQTQQEHTASTNKALLASQNHGQPAIAATAKPGEFTGKGVVAAKEVKPTGTAGTNPAGTKALKKKGTTAGTPGAKPADTKTLEKKGPAGTDHAKLNAGTTSKSSTTEAKPAVVTPPKTSRPNTPTPRAAAASPPHTASSHPAAKPTPKGKPHA